MPLRGWWRCVRASGPAALPRGIALVWAAWGAATAYAYLDGAPPQLATVENLLHMPLWILWATAAVLLVCGALVPPKAPQRAQETGAWLRGIGLAITAGLLGAWSVEFFATDASRGWVSAKNYVILAACAIHHAWVIGRNRAPRRGGA